MSLRVVTGGNARLREVTEAKRAYVRLREVTEVTGAFECLSEVT